VVGWCARRGCALIRQLANNIADVIINTLCDKQIQVSASAAAEDVADDVAKSLSVGVNRPEDQGAVDDDGREEATYLLGAADDPRVASNEVSLHTFSQFSVSNKHCTMYSCLFTC